jgi:hypothetical protein
MSETTKHRWFQFGVRELMLAVTLIAFGLGLLIATWRNAFHLNAESSEALITWIGLIYASGAMIGAGLLSPFRLKTIGLILGFLLVYPVLILCGVNF